MIAFRPIDSGYLNVYIISPIVGVGPGNYDSLVQVDVRGGRYLSERALLGIMTPRRHSVSPYRSPTEGKHKALTSLLGCTKFYNSYSMLNRTSPP
jgi:hypothetical protein